MNDKKAGALIIHLHALAQRHAGIPDDDTYDTLHSAADEIKRLREALEPFAKMATKIASRRLAITRDRRDAFARAVEVLE